MKNDIFIAHVELSKAKFSHDEMGVDFKNEIDAWTKMEFNFRSQIHELRKTKTLRSKTRRGKKELNSLVYSIREKIE